MRSEIEWAWRRKLGERTILPSILGPQEERKGPCALSDSIRVLEEDWLHNTALSRGRCVLREGPFIERWADRIYRVREV